MNKSVREIYTLVHNNHVQTAGTNLSDITGYIKNHLPGARGHDFFWRKMKENDKFTFEWDGKEFHLQKLSFRK